MKKMLFIFALAAGHLWAANTLEQKLPMIKGEDRSLKVMTEKGPVLVVNIATRCGFTGQLDDLEKLYQKYKGKGLTVVGVPSNDFGGQTPEGDKEVAKFCRLNYGVSFPLVKKQVVSGDKKHPLYQWLLQQDPQKGGEVRWNFEKFLLNKEGKVIARYRSSTKPLAGELTKKIESLL